MTRQRSPYRFQLPSSGATRISAFWPSFALHAILIAGSVKATAIAASQIEEGIARRIKFMPPPDRRPNVERVVEKLRYVDIGGGMPILADAPSTDGLRMEVGPKRDEKPGGDAGADLQSEVASTPIVSNDSVYSVLEVETSAVRSAASAAPTYPADMVKQQVEGAVYATFVVDTTGRMETGSLMIITSTHDSFTKSVRTALPLMWFSPATVGGRPVRQQVEQNFRFKLPDPPAPRPTKPSPA